MFFLSFVYTSVWLQLLSESNFNRHRLSTFNAADSFLPPSQVLCLAFNVLMKEIWNKFPSKIYADISSTHQYFVANISATWQIAGSTNTSGSEHE